MYEHLYDYMKEIEARLVRIEAVQERDSLLIHELNDWHNRVSGGMVVVGVLGSISVAVGLVILRVLIGGG